MVWAFTVVSILDGACDKASQSASCRSWRQSQKTPGLQPHPVALGPRMADNLGYVSGVQAHHPDKRTAWESRDEKAVVTPYILLQRASANGALAWNSKPWFASKGAWPDPGQRPRDPATNGFCVAQPAGIPG